MKALQVNNTILVWIERFIEPLSELILREVADATNYFASTCHGNVNGYENSLYLSGAREH